MCCVAGGSDGRKRIGGTDVSSTPLMVVRISRNCYRKYRDHTDVCLLLAWKAAPRNFNFSSLRRKVGRRHEESDYLRGVRHRRRDPGWQSPSFRSVQRSPNWQVAAQCVEIEVHRHATEIDNEAV